MALVAIGFSYYDIMNMPAYLPLEFLQHADRVERNRLVSNAVALRAAFADAKTWDSWVKGVTNG